MNSYRVVLVENPEHPEFASSFPDVASGEPRDSGGGSETPTAAIATRLTPTANRAPRRTSHPRPTSCAGRSASTF